MCVSILEHCARIEVINLFCCWWGGGCQGAHSGACFVAVIWCHIWLCILLCPLHAGLCPHLSWLYLTCVICGCVPCAACSLLHLDCNVLSCLLSCGSSCLQITCGTSCSVWFTAFACRSQSLLADHLWHLMQCVIHNPCLQITCGTSCNV